MTFELPNIAGFGREKQHTVHSLLQQNILITKLKQNEYKVPVTAFTFPCNKIHNKRSSEKNLKSNM